MDYNKIVFIDSGCVVCNGLAKWIVGKSEKIFIAPLDGKIASKHLSHELQQIDQVYYLTNGELTGGFIAIKKLYRELSPVLFWIGLSWVPSFIGNPAYGLFAKVRKLFQSEECPYPPPVNPAPERYLE
jgi:predicted DCC family thiol-disulfide oxidoreductase YuxK